MRFALQPIWADDALHNTSIEISFQHQTYPTPMCEPLVKYEGGEGYFRQLVAKVQFARRPCQSSQPTCILIRFSPFMAES